MKSQAHYKKCKELGLNPLLSTIDESYNGEDDGEDGSISSSGNERMSSMNDGEEDTDYEDIDGDDNDNENESSGK